MGQKIYEEKLGIDIQNRDPEDQPDGILYEVVAESCIPGIDCSSFESIFEEQMVVNSIRSGEKIAAFINSNVFSIEEKTFFFGTIIPSKYPDGITEKFKITNPNKIPCNVKFDVRKRQTTSPELFAFEIPPKYKQAKIPPHEYFYVKVIFKPTIMASYAGVFEALVENGENQPKTHHLLFDLRGEGALPTLKLEKPKEWIEDKNPLLKFPRVRVDNMMLLPIMLKNEGKINATVKFELSPHDSFKFLDQTTFTLTPKTYQNFNIEFHPKDPGYFFLFLSEIIFWYE